MSISGDNKYRLRLAKLLRWFVRVRVSGTVHLPRSGRTIIAMNHCGVRGALIFNTVASRDIVYLASGRFLRSGPIAEQARHMSTLFVDRSNMLDLQLFDQIDHVMKGGSCIGIMLDGVQTTLDQELPKRGAVYLSYRLKADIVPVKVRKTWFSLHYEVHPPLAPASSVKHQALQAVQDQLCKTLGLDSPDSSTKNNKEPAKHALPLS